MRGCSASVVTRELGKHPVMNCHVTPLQGAANTSSNKCWFALCKLKHLLVVGIQIRIDALESNLVFLKKLRIIIR